MRILLVISLALFMTACVTSGPSIDGRQAAKANADLGLKYMEQGKYEAALDKFKRALDFDSSSLEAHHYIAELYRRLGETKDADRHYREAIDTDSDNSLVRYNYGVFLYNQKRYAESEKQFLEVLTNPVYPDRPKALENVGLCQLKVGKKEKAEASFRKALEMNPGLSTSLLMMGELAHTAGKSLSARGYLQRYREVAPHTPESLWLGIRVEQELGDRDAVASYGMLLKGVFPDSEEAKLYLKQQR